ncbi:undecaprenyl-phosphate glucose phosphotransferase [Paenibacillus agaridevorans]|uniref:Undecaprenyl-phosphate glucose phosphotransferase n=2 Tax=Paenibacillus agaridevorans TaxID=171404 RepID=A0A2R5EX90_9BACL|nr:undecaprenyl-phosphate glucose phosphotransferase [Paenibacillus agaridevorans]
MTYHNPLPRSEYFYWSVVYGLLALLLGYTFAFYTTKRRKRFSAELLKIIQIQFMTFLALLSVFFILKVVDISRAYLALFLFSSIFLISLYRLFVKLVLRWIREKGFNKQFVVIVGAGSLGKRFYKNLQHYPELGYEVIGFLDDHLIDHEVDAADYPDILGPIEKLGEVLNRNHVDEVIIALPLHAHEKFERIVELCEKAGVKALIIPDYFDFLPARPYFENFADMPLINVRDIPLDELRNRMAKRGFDIAFSLFSIILTVPLMLLIVLGIKMTSPGPVIYSQERVGLRRKTFRMYKFRSMRIQTELSSDQTWTVENDPRRTRFGVFLRRTSLDELPQFFNVLLGHMSVVGPRPERPYFVERFKEEVPKYMVKHHIRPGITGWAQSNGYRGDTSIPDRIKLDIFYIENWTLIFDIKIIMKTIYNGFFNRNAY